MNFRTVLVFYLIFSLGLMAAPCGQAGDNENRFSAISKTVSNIVSVILFVPTVIIGAPIVAVMAVSSKGSSNDPKVIWSKMNKARVVRVVDLTTLELEGGSRVCLAGVDPEGPYGIVAQMFPGGFAGGGQRVQMILDEALTGLRAKVEGKVVGIEYPNRLSSLRNRDGLPLLMVDLQNLESVNRWIVERGYAKAAPIPAKHAPEETVLRFMEHEAQRGKKGMWQ